MSRRQLDAGGAKAPLLLAGTLVLCDTADKRSEQWIGLTVLDGAD